MKKKTYWGEFSQEDMKILLKNSKKYGWRNALDMLCDNYPEKEDFFRKIITGKTRTDWKKYLNINKKTKILDIGCGLGAISYEMAKISDYVYSLELVPERLEFTQLRTRQDNLKVIGVKKPIFDLKYKSKFDVIILMGVLEWIPYMLDSNDPIKTHKKVLSKIRSMLKENGILVLGIENRFSWEYFLGNVNHYDIPFTSILPRFISNQIYRFYRGKPYQTLTYSFKELNRILLSTGFQIDNFLLTHPTYQNPKLLLESNSRSIKLENKFNSNGIKRKIRNLMINLLVKSGFHKYVASHYIVISHRSES